MPSFVRPFRRLQWKLTFSYTWITVTTLLLLILAGSLIGTEVAAANLSRLAVQDLQVQAAEVEPYLSSPAPDRAQVARWLQQTGPITMTSRVALLQNITITT